MPCWLEGVKHTESEQGHVTSGQARGRLAFGPQAGSIGRSEFRACGLVGRRTELSLNST
jgi:hypothetical protein